jgi:membrane protein required for colicin V production
MNWIDLVFGLILGASVFSGFRKGLLRIGVGLGATIVGFVVASWSYGTLGFSLRPYVPNKAAANFFAFLLIFITIIAIGGLIATILARVFKLVGLTPVDRVLGALFGAVRGLLVCVIIVMIMLAFAPGSTRAAVGASYVGPYVIDASRVLSSITPHEIRDGVRDGYDVVKDMWTETFKKKHNKKNAEDSKDTL